MTNSEIFELVEKHQIPFELIETKEEAEKHQNTIVFPIYNGESGRGKRLVNSLDNPEERTRLKTVSDLKYLSIKYEIEKNVLKKTEKFADIFLVDFLRIFEVKPLNEFYSDKNLRDIYDYGLTYPTIVLTFNFETKEYITKDKDGKVLHFNNLREIIYPQLIKEDELVNITNDKVDELICEMIKILYKYNVSDYSRGLDIISKLIACKIVDENYTNEDGVMKMQVIDNETNESFNDKLTKLYLESAKELNNKVKDDYMCPQAQFYIIEVDDDDSYLKNIKIIKELIEQIQRLKFVKVGNVNFVTKLFERLEKSKTLKDYGIFTTDPNITDWITMSIPIKDYIKKTGNVQLIYQDPAVGTGHFANSFVEVYNDAIFELHKENFRPLKKNDKLFIDEYVNNGTVKLNYITDKITGIDVQKRNIELCRINTTLKNGVPIKCYHGNSLKLSLFEEKYSNREEFQNEKLDFITSNYPFSVKGFVKDLSEKDKEHFELSKLVTDKTSEIEDLFVEDTINKLKPNGISAFIIFESVLWKSIAINSEIRKKLLIDCEIVSIVKLGSEAFKNTSIKSVAIFIRKRTKEEKEILNKVDEFFQNYEPIIINGDNAIEKFTEDNYGYDFNTYVEHIKSLLKNNKTKSQISDEINKLKIFLINLESKILYSDISFEKYDDVNLKKNQILEKRKKLQRDILGFSNSSYDTKKFTKSSYLPILAEKIKSMYYPKEDTYNMELKKFESLTPINDIIDYEDGEGFAISFEGNPNDYMNEKFENKEFVPLNDVIKFLPKLKHRKNDGIIGGKYPFYTSSGNEEVFLTVNEWDKEGEFLLVNNGGESFIRITGEDSKWSATGDVIIMESIDSKIPNKFIYKFLKNNPNVLRWTYKGSGLKHSSIGRLKKILLPKLNADELKIYLS